MFWRKEERGPSEREAAVQELQETIGSVAKNLEESLSKLEQLLNKVVSSGGRVYSTPVSMADTQKAEILHGKPNRSGKRV